MKQGKIIKNRIQNINPYYSKYKPLLFIMINLKSVKVNSVSTVWQEIKKLDTLFLLDPFGS